MRNIQKIQFRTLKVQYLKKRDICHSKYQGLFHQDLGGAVNTEKVKEIKILWHSVWNNDAVNNENT